MAEVKWIKLSTDMFNNSKIKFIRSLPQGNDIVLIWVFLLCKAGICNEGGFIYLTEEIPYTSETISNEINIPINTVKLGFETFQKLNMVKKDERGFDYIIGWEEHQSVLKLEAIREYNRINQQKSRQRLKLLKSKTVNDTVNDMSLTCQECHDTDIDKDKDKDKKDIDNKSDFQNPTKPNPIDQIFNYWNSKKIIMHRKLTDKMKRAIKAALKNYKQDEICTAINNYTTILNDSQYYWSYKWELDKFLQRGLSMFIDFNTAASNYKRKEINQNGRVNYEETNVGRSTNKGNITANRIDFSYKSTEKPDDTGLM